MGWFALVAPTGMPAAAIERCHRVMQALLADKEIAERITTIGLLVDGSLGVDAVGAFLCSEATRWSAITREIGLLPE